jgi:hypothetical protein
VTPEVAEGVGEGLLEVGGVGAPPLASPLGEHVLEGQEVALHLPGEEGGEELVLRREVLVDALAGAAGHPGDVVPVSRLL